MIESARRNGTPEVPINAACSCPRCTEARPERLLAEKDRRIAALEYELNGLADHNAHLKFALAWAEGKASGNAAMVKQLGDELRLALEASAKAIRERDQARAEIDRMMGVEDGAGPGPDRGADRPRGEARCFPMVTVVQADGVQVALTRCRSIAIDF